jgi:hypothetical protein
VTPKAAYQRLDTGSVDENGKRHRNQRQLDKLQGQIFDHGGQFAYTRLGGKGNHSRGDEYSVGYPAHKLFWYRGGMQDWENLGLTTVRPESE